MKKIFPLGFIGLLLLNVMGYYGIFLGMKYHNDVAMVRNLNANRYDKNQTLTLRIPISVPYMVDQREFKRVDGMFEHHGEYYRLVKQKYSQDTLTVICVKDFENKRIQQALSNYVKSFTDKPVDQSQNKGFFSFIRDYMAQSFSLAEAMQGWSRNINRGNPDFSLLPAVVSYLIHPPDFPYTII